jgi:hypothetical protein
MASYSPEVTLTKDSTDPTRMDVKFSNKVPSWVDGYIKAITAREMSPGQEVTHQQLGSAKKFLDGMLENLVNTGLIYRAGASDEFKSAGE